MIQEPTLFMILLGCKPDGRHTEQHDIFFAIGHELKDLVEDMHGFWPEAKRKLHIDAWRMVSQVGTHRIRAVRKNDLRKDEPLKTGQKLYFLNLGGYKPDDFEEYHYKVLVVADSKATAIREAKESAFFRHQLSAHVDDQYGVDVDDLTKWKIFCPLSLKNTMLWSSSRMLAVKIQKTLSTRDTLSLVLSRRLEDIVKIILKSFVFPITIYTFVLML